MIRRKLLYFCSIGPDNVTTEDVQSIAAHFLSVVKNEKENDATFNNIEHRLQLFYVIA